MTSGCSLLVSAACHYHKHISKCSLRSNAPKLLMTLTDRGRCGAHAEGGVIRIVFYHLYFLALVFCCRVCKCVFCYQGFLTLGRPARKDKTYFNVSWSNIYVNESPRFTQPPFLLSVLFSHSFYSFSASLHFHLNVFIAFIHSNPTVKSQYWWNIQVNVCWHFQSSKNVTN